MGIVVVYGFGRQLVWGGGSFVPAWSPRRLCPRVLLCYPMNLLKIYLERERRYFIGICSTPSFEPFLRLRKKLRWNDSMSRRAY